MQEISIITLSKDYLNSHFEEIIALDAGIVDQSWKRENFLLDLPGKWVYSQAVVRDNFPIGFLIASVKDTNLIHVHRLVIAETYRNQGLGKKLMANLAKIAIIDRLQFMTLKTSKNNINAQRFYSKIGFIVQESSNINNLEFIILLETLIQNMK